MVNNFLSSFFSVFFSHIFFFICYTVLLLFFFIYKLSVNRGSEQGWNSIYASFLKWHSKFDLFCFFLVFQVFWRFMLCFCLIFLWDITASFMKLEKHTARSDTCFGQGYKKIRLTLIITYFSKKRFCNPPRWFRAVILEWQEI